MGQGHPESVQAAADAGAPARTQGPGQRAAGPLLRPAGGSGAVAGCAPAGRAGESQFHAARLALISNLVERGEINQAIEESRKLAQAAPATRTRLIELLIARNRQQPEGQRDWREVEELLKQEAAVSPKSAEPLLLRAEMAAARGNSAEAQALLDSARKQFPRDVRSWVASADLLRQRGKFEPAVALLDQAQQALGDSVELRRERARVLVSRGGTDLVERLDELSRNTAAFPPQDRQRFLKAMGEEIGRLEGGLTAAARIWSEVAALDPNAIEPQLQRLEIAFQAATNAEDALKTKAGSGREGWGRGGQGRDRSNHRPDRADRGGQRPERPSTRKPGIGSGRPDTRPLPPTSRRSGTPLGP